MADVMEIGTTSRYFGDDPPTCRANSALPSDADSPHARDRTQDPSSVMPTLYDPAIRLLVYPNGATSIACGNMLARLVEH